MCCCVVVFVWFLCVCVLLCFFGGEGEWSCFVLYVLVLACAPVCVLLACVILTYLHVTCRLTMKVQTEFVSLTLQFRLALRNQVKLSYLLSCVISLNNDLVSYKRSIKHSFINSYDCFAGTSSCFKI